MKNLLICFVLGTRPEIIKMSPVIKECQRRGVGYFVLHTGQHYDEKMDKIFFDDLGLPTPNYNLKISGKPYRKQVGIMIKKLIPIFAKEKPSIVLVQGDTISVLAGALAANKLGIKLAHHEAGLRSHDTKMLEEVNRVIVDHISDILLVPTKDALRNLRQEGISAPKIFFTGNTVVDAVMQNFKNSQKKSSILKKMGLKRNGYILATCHRAENVDNIDNLSGILNGFYDVFLKIKLPIILPIHPRTKNNIEKFNLKIPEGIITIEPQGFFDFLQLEGNAKIILTDSGGVQEEACILKVPCVTLRDNTERPETLKIKSNILAGTNSKKISKACEKMLSVSRVWQNPFGDGKSAEKIIEIIIKLNENN